MLWRVVQACLATHRVSGFDFPCLDVEPSRNGSSGYVVLRAPLETTHIIVTPAVRVIGIEDEVLLKPDAPRIFAEAWNARHFVADALPRPPAREDLGMAVNSRPGRSQDQLHVHVDCVRADVKASLARQVERLKPGRWTDLSLAPRAPRYAATLLSDAGFEHDNIVALARSGLGVPAGEMEGVTIAVIPVRAEGRAGFAVLTRRRIPASRDEAHGEALLDHGCSALR